MKRSELLSSPEYWTAELQMELYRQIEAYMEENGLNKSQLAQKLGCTKGYVSQLLNGDFDHKMSKFFELALAIGKVPEFNFVDLGNVIEADENGFSQTTSLNTKDNFEYNSSLSDFYTTAA